MVHSTAEKLSASLEDYLEAIFNLSARENVARSRDIAGLLGVTRSSVTGALKVLGDRQLVNYQPYGLVTLTPRGRRLAWQVARRHDIIKSFFVEVLGVEQGQAHEAACKAEHALGPVVISRLLNFIEFVTRSGREGYDLAGQFRLFYQSCADSEHSSEEL